MYSNLKFDGKTLKPFPLKSGTRKGGPLYHLRSAYTLVFQPAKYEKQEGKLFRKNEKTPNIFYR